MLHSLRRLCLLSMITACGCLSSWAQTNTVRTTSSNLPGGGTGSHNVAIGPGNTHSDANGADDNVMIGDNAGRDITTGEENILLSSRAGSKITSGSNNVMVGSWAGVDNSTGNDNAFLGYRAGWDNVSGNSNTFLGSLAGSNTLSGNDNTFVGKDAGISNTIGGSNVFTGSSAGYSNTRGNSNIFTGRSAGFANTTGYSNVFTGTFTGTNNVNGYANTFIGTSANSVGAKESSLNRATALGHNAKVAVNSGLVLGDTSRVKVGIGTAYPDQRLTIRGNINYVAYDNSMMLKGSPFLHFNEHESLALGLGAELPAAAKSTLVLGSSETEVQLPGVASNYLANSGQILTVDESGKVLLTRPHIQVQSTADWADKVFEENYALRPLSEVEEFVKKNKHLPGVPSAETMVTEGMESAAFNAKLLEKIEELTLYVVKLEKRLKEVEKK